MIGVGFGGSLTGLMMATMVALLAFQLIGGKYRSFVWYKSGKKGFLFFWANGVFWLAYLLSIFLFNEGSSVWYFALILVLISVGGLFILGEVLRRE